MKYFKDIELIYEKFYIISKYCPISSSNVNTVVTDINKVQILTIVAKYIILIKIAIEIILLIIVLVR